MKVETAHVHKAHNAEENKDERDKPKLPSFSAHPWHQILCDSRNKDSSFSSQF